MRLKTKLVLAVTALTFAVVLLLSLIFMGELLRQRVAQTAAANDVLARSLALNTQQALVVGLRQNPPEDSSDGAFQAAVMDTLRGNDALAAAMNAVVRYAPTVQDVYIANAHGVILVSTDPDMLGQQAPYRTTFDKMSKGGVLEERRVIFGSPQVLDTALPLDRNGQPFLAIHLGVRSTLLRNSYAPWLRAALIFSGLAMLGCIVAAALLANLALRPIETISVKLEQLTLAAGSANTPLLEAKTSDAVVRASRSIERIGEQIRTTEQVYTTLQSNLNTMLSSLRDGVILFTGDHRAIMVSEAFAALIGRDRDGILGQQVEQIFDRETSLGRAVRQAFAGHINVLEDKLRLENGREVQLSIEFLHHDNVAVNAGAQLGALLTLHDAESAQELEKEIEVSRRLAAIGRLTAGVGHEVKNPINAMVLHLELLRNKLSANGDQGGAQRHVEILSTEMQRLDRVVQTLADFSRPVELQMKEHDLRDVVKSVLDLAAVQIEQDGVVLEREVSSIALPVRADAELLKQALLNILLNGAQAMPDGGRLRVEVVREGQTARLSIRDEGTGIPENVRAKIFDLYFTTKPKGSGIGLAMTYRIVQLHGGGIDVTSDTDADSSAHGTVFVVTLPLDMTGMNKLLPLTAGGEV